MPNTNEHKLVTIVDLENFKIELIASIEKMLKSSKNLKSRRWLKSSEVIKLIRVSPGKLKTIRDTGMIAFTKIGGNIYYDQEDIVNLFEKNKATK